MGLGRGILGAVNEDHMQGPHLAHGFKDCMIQEF
jgi:hypothetical protein